MSMSPGHFHLIPWYISLIFRFFQYKCIWGLRIEAQAWHKQFIFCLKESDQQVPNPLIKKKTTKRYAVPFWVTELVKLYSF